MAIVILLLLVLLLLLFLLLLLIIAHQKNQKTKKEVFLFSVIYMYLYMYLDFAQPKLCIGEFFFAKILPIVFIEDGFFTFSKFSLDFIRTPKRLRTTKI